MKYTKKDDHTLGVERPEVVVKGETKEYSLNYLKSQERAIQAQIDRHTEKFRKDLEEVQEMIAKAEKLGVVEKVYEEDNLERE